MVKYLTGGGKGAGMHETGTTYVPALPEAPHWGLAGPGLARTFMPGEQAPARQGRAGQGRAGQGRGTGTHFACLRVRAYFLLF